MHLEGNEMEAVLSWEEVKGAEVKLEGREIGGINEGLLDIGNSKRKQKQENVQASMETMHNCTNVVTLIWQITIQNPSTRFLQCYFYSHSQRARL